MPNFSASFSVKGNVTQATAAAKQFVVGLNKMDAAFTRLNQRAAGLTALNEEVSSFSRRSHAFVRNTTEMAYAANSLARAVNNLATAWRNLNAASGGRGSGFAAEREEHPASDRDDLPGIEDVLSDTGRQTATTAQEVTQAVASAAAWVEKFGVSVESFNKVNTIFDTGLAVSAKALGVVGIAAGATWAVFKGGTAVVKGVGNVLNDVWNRISTSFTKFLQISKNAFTQFVRMGLDAFDGLRMVFLGFTNIARALFFFVSIPLSGAIYKLAGVFLDWEDALKRVQKTTGLTNAQMEQEFIPALRELAKYTRTSHVQLAKMAEQAGQLGLETPKGIVDLVEIANMVAISTDIMEDQVVESLGRVSNAFGWNLDKSSEEIWRLANVINMLENTTASSAGEIVESIERFAPVARILNITAWQAAALSATIVAMGWDAHLTGTSLQNMGIYMARNAGEIAHLMSANEKYNTTQKFTQSLQEDFVGTLKDVVGSLGEEEDVVRRLNTVFEEFNLRGGRGVASMSNNIVQLIENLDAAEKEWTDANSLLIEYDRAMSSAQAQTEVLRNNVNDLGIEIGTTFLPSINQVVQILIGFVQILTDLWKALDKDTQFLIVMGVAITAFIGPLTFFLSQIIHGIFLAIMGLFQFTTIIPRTIAVFLALIKVFATFGGLIKGWPAALLAVGVFIMRNLQKSGVDIAQFFVDLGEKGLNWGLRLAETFSSGFLKGAALWIGRALQWVGNLIASFLRGSSPPPVGVLSTIDTWGRKVIDAYLQGFLLADFSILNQIGRTIENVLQNISIRGGKDDSWVTKLVAEARVHLARLIDVFNETGKVADDILHRVVANLGDMGEAIARLIKLQLEYNQLQRQLDEIERKRQSVQNTYVREIDLIGAANLSAKERADLIRQAMRTRDQELKQLADEERDLKEQRDLAKDQYEWQKAYVDALIEQEDVLNRLIRALDRLGGALENIEPLPVWGGDDGEPDDQIQKAMDDLYNLKKRLEDTKLAVQGFFAALRGDDPLMQGVPAESTVYQNFKIPDDVFEQYMTFYGYGEKIRDIWLQIQGAIDGVAGSPLWEKDPAAWAEMSQEEKEAYSERFRKMEELRSFFEDVIGVVDTAIKKAGSFWDSITGKGKGAVPPPAGASVVVGPHMGNAEAGQTTGFLDEVLEKIKNIGLAFGVLTGILPALNAFQDVKEIPFFKQIHELNLERFKGLQDALAGLVDALDRLFETLGLPTAKEGTNNFGKLIYYIEYASGLAWSQVMLMLESIFGNMAQWATDVINLVTAFTELLILLDQMKERKVTAEQIQAVFDSFKKALFPSWGTTDTDNPFYKQGQTFGESIGNGIKNAWENFKSKWDTEFDQKFKPETKLNTSEKLLAWKTTGEKWQEELGKGLDSDAGWANIDKSIASSLGALASSGALYDKLYTLGKSLWDSLVAGFTGETYVSASSTTRTTEYTGGTGSVGDNVVLGEGGNVYSGRSYIVGDRGWEAFLPKVSGYVAAHKTLEEVFSNSQGSGTMININNPVIRDEQDIDRLARAVERVLARRTQQQMSLGRA